MPTTIVVDQHEAVLRVTLNRPESHNAFDSVMIAELTAVFSGLASRSAVRAVILTGTGRTFCAGADLAGMQAAANMPLAENLADGEAIWALMEAVDRAPMPVIGRINGSVFGGGIGLVSCCDVAIAVERARFSFSEVRLGLVPAVISPFVISKIGLSQARALFLTGERFDARFAQSIGLIHQIVGEDDLDGAVASCVQQLLAGAPHAQMAAKSLLRSVLDLDRAEQRRLTTELIARLRAGPEGQEGLSAFLEKRKPFWSE